MTAPAKITTDNPTLAVDLSECRGLLRMDEEEAPDAELSLIVQSATRRLEDDTNRSLTNKSYTWYIDRFTPSRDPLDDFWYSSTQAARGSNRNGLQAIILPIAPLVSITSIRYRDGDGDLITIDAADYQVDTHSEPGVVSPSPASVAWPAVNPEYLNPIEFVFVAGFGTKSQEIPFRLRHAIIMLAGHFFEHPEATMESAFNLRDVDGYKETVAHYKTRRF
jgi:hypothetical protein